MTNERAIEIIKRKISIPLEGENWEEIDEAYDMAIKALEERPTCMTCKYKGCYVTEKPCKECSHAWVDKYEEAENE